MAEKRMFAKTIIDSDAFLEMPVTSQLLYFHLSMRADDDGFINKPKAIMKMIGANTDDIKILFAKKFVIPFDSGVVVIKHWRINNYIRNDTHHDTTYTDEMAMLELDANNAYTLKSETPLQIRNETVTQISIDKNSLGKDRLDKYIYSLPLKDGTEYEVTETYVEELKAAYPGKDLDNEFNRMRAWLISNPSKQKTGRGIKRFINGWLSRDAKKASDYEEVKPSWMTEEWEREWNESLGN